MLNAGRTKTLPALVPLLILLSLAACAQAGCPSGPEFAETIEDFDAGTVQLLSYPGQDVDRDSWILDTLVRRGDSGYSLKLYGNTWKVEPLTPIALDTGDVWQVAVYVESLGEIQGFGLVAGADTLLYSLAGTEEVDPVKWVTVYQGAFPQRTWNVYQLPVAEDWLARFGRLPTVSAIVFVDDRDMTPRGKVYFDEILDITHDLPIPPHVEIWHTMGDIFDSGEGLLSVTVQFHSRVTDPDSRSHNYFWYFGDDSTSQDSNPVHTYVVTDNHEYTVLIEVVDSTGRWGRASCQVTVDPGPSTFPVRVNFVGDIMLARRYDTPGGIIDTLGPGGIFDPTLPWLGDAADMTIANLESPLTANGTRHPTKPIVFRGRPGNVAGLAHAGIDVVSLANNHVIDYGLEGMRETQESLAANRIVFSGAGANSYEACSPVFRQKSGVNIAFLACCDRNGQYDNYQPYLDAGFNKPGFAYLNSYHVRDRIREVEGTADLVVVEMHTGEEYEPTPMDGRGDDQAKGDEWYSPLAFFPAPGDTEERHRAIEAGADLVVCHHPHVLQGFEVYQGKLIAHSLGNFTFDLDYPETYPTAILNARIDETGFFDYSVTPVFLDDYIPRRAGGELGAYVLDYLARRSRDLGTYLVVNEESVTARIVLDTSTLTPTVYPFTGELQLRNENGYWTSNPLRLPGYGSLSSVISATPSGDWQFRIGREMVWFGNCEDEGSTMWLLNQTDERYDTVPYRGRRSLRQTRLVGGNQIVTNLEDRLPCYSDSTGYTLYGYVKTQNARNADAAVQFYTGRTGSSPIGSSSLGASITGTTDWTFYYTNFVPAGGAAYFDVWLESEGPQSGAQGYSWFDDIGIVEWEQWQPLDNPVSVATPNDYCWVQIRTGAQTSDATLSYEETSYGPQVKVRERPGREPDLSRFQSYPNPAHTNPAIRYSLTGTAAVTLRVYNVLGQEVRTLVDAPQVKGPKTVVWDGKDNHGRTLAAGTYFCRLRVGEREQTRTVVLLR